MESPGVAGSAARVAAGLPVRIAGTSTIEAGVAVSTVEVAQRVQPPRNPAAIVRKTGIVSRRIALPDESPADLGRRALEEALRAAGLRATDLERIILVTSGGGDLVIPATANLIARGMGLAGTCDCFDLNNACMGFLTALDIAARGIATGSGPVGIAVVEPASRGLTPDNPRPYLVFGDGVSAAVITPATGDEGILGSWLRNDAIAFGNVRLANAGLTRKPEFIQFTASADTMGGEAIEALQRSTFEVLDRVGLTIDDVEWVLPHQPNGVLLNAIVHALGVAEERVVRVVDYVGSVGAASIPISLDRLLRTRDVRTGDRVLMVGVGAGLSFGAMLYRAP
jgi:3-oxoacyl-(acyl-carrier-protein) synthase III